MKEKLLFWFPSLPGIVIVLLCGLILVGLVSSAQAQGVGGVDRDSARTMLSVIKDDLKDNYYDPSLRGMNLEARFKEAEEKIKQATTRDQLVTIVAQVVLELNDSHTFFLPPSRAARVEYGWLMQMVGDDCYITAVKPNSDAEAKGVKPGDAILSLDGVKPTRLNFWKMLYRYYALVPSRSLRMVIQSPGEAQPRGIDVSSKIQPTQSVTQWQSLFMRYLSEEWDIDHDGFYEVNNDLLVWKMLSFEISKERVDDVMSKARKYKTLVIDLRGNGGGYVETLSRLVSHFFDKEIKIADLKGRKDMKPQLAKKRETPFSGKLVVLVDSNSASASELFARVMQIEKRGTVIGDRTAGAVMTARQYPHETGLGRVLYFGASVTIADMIMSDGQSLEHIGVRPDELLLPIGPDLAAKRDPVLSRAAELAGVKLDPEKAGTLFPVEWKRQ